MSNDKTIEKRFVKASLQDTSKKISKDVYKKTSSFRSNFWNARRFAVSEDTMVYQHNIINRFVDMKTRKQKDGTKKRKKSHVVHNRIVMGNYSGLVKTLSFGFTEEIKNKFRNMQNP